MLMKSRQVCWFEIPAKNLDRAIAFYSSFLSVQIEKRLLLDKYYGVFDKNTHLISGCLVEKENYSPGNGTVIFFCVDDLSEALRRTIDGNGSVVIPKTLIKQSNNSGDIIVSKNLIDENIGYFAEIIDTEGNHIGLYSNS
jgi:predicted enzyme related to lactoylglutathione lyase